MKKRISAVILLLIATTVSVFAAFRLGINPPMANVLGAYASIAAVAILMKLKISDGLYYMGLIFVFFASPIGSVLNLYRSFDPYDKIIHYISGLLLAALGVTIITYLLKKMDLHRQQIEAAALMTAVFAFLTASAGAGIWEIFEFTADKLTGGGMQRGMIDTLTDMIAGNLGGLTYAAAVWINRGRAKS